MSTVLINKALFSHNYLGEELGYESRETTIPQNSSSLHIGKFKWHGCIKKIFFFFAIYNTTGRFRVGFGLGDISNMIEH